MKRKYLSALLMGVLTLSSVSTFTSCKDYDDDISNLQGQIDKLATADQLSQKVAELQALISSNKSDITSLQAKLADKTTLDEVKAVLANYATKEYVDGADATLQAAIKALETGKVAELEAAVKAAQAAADKAAEDAKAANAEILETLKTLATKAEVTEAADAAQKAIAAVESNNAEALKKAQAEILETLKDYATKKDLKDVADAAQKALDDAQKDNSKALADLDTAVKNAQSKANTAAADATKALADLVKTTKNATDALKQANDNKTAIENALKLLGEGYSAENTVAAAIQAIRGQIGTPDKKLGTLDSRLAAIESVLNGVKDDDTKLGLATKVTNIETQLKNIIGEYTTMVTEVNLLGSFKTDGTLTAPNMSELQFTSGTVADDFIFGKAEKASATYQVPAATNQQTFVKGTTFNTKTELVVRVNPVNAVLTKAAIKLVDSKNNNLDNILEIGEPEKYDKLFTKTRAANNTGLWKIPVTVKPGVARTAIEQLNEGKHILYAVAVNNTNSEAAKDRYVTSTYDIVVPKAKEFDKPTALTTIGNVKIKSVNTMADENPILLSNAMPYADGHVSGTIVPAKSGEDITIDFGAYKDQIQYFYVVRDDSNVDGGSGSSAINAWKSYEYGGSAYGNVVEVNPADKTPTINVKINGQKGDKIGFRIFAVKYNGKVIPENGQSFVVNVGEDENQASVKGDLVAVTESNNETGWLPLTGTLKDGNATTVDVSGNFTAENGVAFTATFAKDANGTPATKNSEIKYVKFKTTSAIKNWEDGSTINHTIIQKDGDNMVKNQISVSLTKKLPTAADAKTYTWKDEQLVNGVYTAYVTPGATAPGTSVNPWKLAAAKGHQKMTQAISNLKDGFEFKIENVKKDGNDKYTEPLTFKSAADEWTVAVDKALIDGTTQHKTTISYNYGDISSVKGAWVVPVETFNIVFACPLTDAVQKYTWGKLTKNVGTAAKPVYKDLDVNYLTYNNGTTVDGVDLLKYIIGTNSYYGAEFGGPLFYLVNGGTDTSVTPNVAYKQKYTSIKIDDLKLVSDGSGLPDYFKAEIDSSTHELKFVPQSGTSNPVNDVKSHLKFTVVDAFGHEIKYSLPFTVKKAQ